MKSAPSYAKYPLPSASIAGNRQDFQQGVRLYFPDRPAALNKPYASTRPCLLLTGPETDKIYGVESAV